MSNNISVRGGSVKKTTLRIVPCTCNKKDIDLEPEEDFYEDLVPDDISFSKLDSERFMDSMVEIADALEKEEAAEKESKEKETDCFEHCMAELDALIGLDDVKVQVRKIVAFAKMQKDIRLMGKSTVPVALNMEFTGNPGTAKTTVARIFARLFQSIGIISDREILEVGRADLVAEYVGQTAKKVRQVFAEAKGKLLFIDEAYSLFDSQRDSFADEAISTIIQEMENHRDDTIVVFAGYPDKMREMFNVNPGMRSRVPFTISFKDYSAEEMVQIAELEAKKRGFTVEESAKARLLSACEAAAGDPEKGNGRFCRNLIENSILDYAVRVYGSEEKAVEKDFILRMEDFNFSNKSSPEIQHSPKRRQIGFAV